MLQSKPAPSKLPTVLIVVVCASIASYFAFFRGKSSPTEPILAASAQSHPPAAAPRPALAPPVRPPAPPDAAPAAPEPPKPAPKTPPPPPSPARSALYEIEELIAAGKWREARAKLAPLFVSAVSDPERSELAKKGLEISQQLLITSSEEKDVELYEIQQGDTLEGIARKFRNLSGVKGAIMLVNNYRENAILRQGRKVKITHGSWSIVVDKSMFKLWICYEGAPFKSFTVTIGTDQKTPAAKFVVGGKNPKPAWWPPPELNMKGGPIKYGDPQNPLGEWWISLEHDLYHGIGIHGTNDPGSIGSKASNGCVRMLNEEVGDVAAIAYKGMAVTIVE